MKKIANIVCLLWAASLQLCLAQGYTSYFTGSEKDTLTDTKGGACLMGGGTENDAAMRWFLNRANGGDVVVLRASGSDGYNAYFYEELGVAVNSVETIVFESAEVVGKQEVLEKINKAEAIWIAGGDQWNYVDYWRDSPVAEAINAGITGRNIVIGGTSAGMAILGGAYFSARLGTVRSEEALANPLANRVSVDTASFLKVPYLENTITDTHYDSPDRRGRHMAFLAKTFVAIGDEVRGVAADEHTAICIDEFGNAQVFGDYPEHDDNAYFLQVNCGLSNPNPEKLEAGMPLNWDKGGMAVKVYSLKGTPNGRHTFNLDNWESGTGGEWENWWVVEGEFFSQRGKPLDCTLLTLVDKKDSSILNVFPNPSSSGFINIPLNKPYKALFYNLKGEKVLESERRSPLTESSISVKGLPNGVYTVEIQTQSNLYIGRFVKE